MADTTSADTVLGYREIASRLLDAGFAECFGLMGEDTAGLTTSLIAGGIAYRSARQENSAVSMADGFARATGKVGLAIVSRGPGLLNASGALASADRARSSLLVITGDGPLIEGRVAPPALDLKSMDQVAAVTSLGIPTFRPERADEVVDLYEQALATARGGRVAVLSLPITFMEGEIPAAAPTGATNVPIAPTAVDPDTDGVAAAAELIAASDKVVVIGGRGAYLGDARDALVELADRSGGALGTSLLSKSLFAGHPFDLGVVGGFSHQTARDLLAEADCIVSFGAGLNRFTTAAGALLESAQVIQVDADPAQLGLRYPADLTIEGDAALTARAITALLPRREAGDGYRTEAVRARLAERAVDELFEDCSTAEKVDPRTLLIKLNEMVPAARNVTIDCGHFVGYPAMYLDVPGPDHLFWSLHFGMLGIGHGMGLGVALARPEEANVVVVGDGGALMTFGELETLSRLRPKAIVVVLDDGAYIAEKHYLELHGEPGEEAVFGHEVDFAGVAEKLGVESATIRSVADLEAQAPLIAAGGPLVLDVKIPIMRAGWYVESITGEFDES
ncbi:MAG TPA: thiamine pyrophosphate-binding protein [Solirubrobacterales bacterium]|nr:thiamine pyrophosphate-binding protein [Solirubrobacterales bacterium]